jgi:hypothetical protein
VHLEDLVIVLLPETSLVRISCLDTKNQICSLSEQIHIRYLGQVLRDVSEGNVCDLRSVEPQLLQVLQPGLLIHQTYVG